MDLANARIAEANHTNAFDGLMRESHARKLASPSTESFQLLICDGDERAGSSHYFDWLPE
ncbi:hypothetical protein J3R74_000014 [Puniceicoccus vermicola]